MIGIAADGFDGLQFDGSCRHHRALPDANGRPTTRPGRFDRDRWSGASLAACPSTPRARSCSRDGRRCRRRRCRPRCRKPSARRCVGSVVNVAPLASGFSGLRGQYGTTLWVLLAPDGDSPGGRVRQPCGPDPGALADATPPGRDSPRTGWKPAARVLAAAGRRAPAVGGGVRRCGPAGVGDHPSRDGIPPVRTHELEVSDADAGCRCDRRDGVADRLHWPCGWRGVGVAVGRRCTSTKACAPAAAVIGSFGRFGRGLLVAQVALSMTLLVGAGLFTTTLAHLRANDTSLQSQRIVFTRAFREPGDRQTLPPRLLPDARHRACPHAGRRCGGAVGVLPDVLRGHWGGCRRIIATRGPTASHRLTQRC